MARPGFCSARSGFIFCHPILPPPPCQATKRGLRKQHGTSAKGKQQRRDGGLWKAFVREKATGSPGRPDLKQLGADYRRAKSTKDPILDRLAPIAKAATRSGRALRKLGASGRLHPFGPSASALARKRKADSIKTSALALAAMDPVQMLEHMATYSADNFHHGFRIAKRMQTELAKQSKSKFNDEDRVLDEYDAKIGAQDVDAFLKKLPKFPKTCVSRVPSEGAPLFAVNSNAAEAARDICAWAEATQGLNVTETLESQWAARHTTIMHDESIAEKFSDCSPNVNECWKLGWCRCNPDGLTRWRIRNALLQEMKKVFAPAPKGHRKLLASKSVVVKITQASTTAEAAPASDDPWDALAAYQIPTTTTSELWLHIGHISFSPYRPTYQIMYKVDCPHPSLEADTVPRIWLQACFLSLGSLPGQ